ITIPPNPLLVLQTVTPIDHFPLSFLGLSRIEPLAVAIKQQRQRDAMPLSTQIITIIQLVAGSRRQASASSPRESFCTVL
ncbi:hypothetical protein, partial [Mesorhizobium sp.]|uniref:hypothetical protein n=1 Tax=Mesorhizobium sp. TaxID=1871066 RepID=UPI00257A61CC